MINYCIIGKSWGQRIYKILKNLDKKVYLFESSKEYGSKEYFNDFKNFIIKKKIFFVLIATPPLYRFRLINFCLNENLNLILEKPIILKKKKFIKLKNKIKFKKKYCFVHFEYVFLNRLKNISYNSIKKINMHFHHLKKNKHKINQFLNNGTHLVFLKKLYFNKIKKINYFVTEGKKNFRKVELIKNKKKINIDFTNNNEKLIQKFIFYMEHRYKFKKNNILDLKFGYKCTEYINKIIKS